MKKTSTLLPFNAKHPKRLLRSWATTFSLCIAFLLFSFGSVHAQDAFAVTADGKLVSFSASAPGTLLTDVPISGIDANQVIAGLDFRPATGQLYALGYNTGSGQAQLYIIKTTSGVATQVGAPVALAAGQSAVGFDFNPTVDRIRVTVGNNSYRLNPNNGTLVATDGSLAYAAGDIYAGNLPMVYGVAYANSLSAATTTTLYYYDYGTNSIGTVSPPNNGTLNTIGGSGITPSTAVGLDLDIVSNAGTGANMAYLSANVSGTGTNLYSVNLATGAATVVGQIGSNLIITEMSITPAAAVPARIVYGISGSNLISFNSSAPGTILSSTPVTGLAGGETILGIDFRPATGELFALGSGSRLYTINLTSGAATQVGANGAFTLSGSRFGFDFNPTVDRIRVTSNTGQNLRLNPNNGTLAATDGTLAYAAGDVNNGATPNVVAGGYTNNFAGSTATTLYFYDVSLNVVGTIVPPNAGTLNTLGNSGITVDASGQASMDIASDKATGANAAFLAASTNGTSSNLYKVNLLNGSTFSIGAIGNNLVVTSMSVYIAPPPASRVVYAVSQGNLISFNSTTPGTITSSVPLTGVAAGQVIDGLDFRPATGGLYGLGYNAGTGQTQLYTINTNTATAAAVGSPFSIATGLNNISFDFNPAVDRIRLITNTGLNLRLNPNDGTIAATDVALSYAPGDVFAGAQPNVFGVAYANNVAGTSSTQLYYYNINLDQLATTTPPASPNSGQLNSVGSSGLLTQNFLGQDLDIYTNPVTNTNSAFFSANVGGGVNSFYQVNLATGEAQLIGLIGSGILINDFAVSLDNSNLPVTLADFTAVKVGTTAVLQWITKTEVNNSHFIVERSSNGTDFAALGDKIKSKAIDGNSVASLTYGATDGTPLLGTNYYRLLQVDKDGRKQYSQVVSLSFNGETAAKMYPNPVRKVLNLNGYMPAPADVQLTVADANGRIVMTRNFSKQNGNWNIQLNVGGLAKGIYFVQVYSGKSILASQSVIKD